MIVNTRQFLLKSYIRKHVLRKEQIVSVPAKICSTKKEKGKIRSGPLPINTNIMNYPIYVAGEFKETQNTLEVINPHTNETVATTYLATEKEFETATEGALAVQSTLADWPTHKRAEVLEQVAISLTRDRERLGKILAQEAAKPLKYAIGEIDRAAATFKAAAEETKRIPGEEFIRLDWTTSGENKVGIVRQFPIGPVAGIAPFNFPLNLAVHKIAPAIAAGCPIVLKPASSTPLSTLELAKIIDETDLPKGAVSILPMDRITGNKLVTDDRYKLLSFTGSPGVGWKMKADAGEKPVVLELGGNAGVIISESSTITDTMIKNCLNGAFSYQGQVCIHTQRFYVHESHLNKFVDQLKYGAENLIHGLPDNPETEFSAMIDKKNAQRIENWVDEAIEAGAQLITGGKREGALYKPTILTNVPKDAKIMAEEAFGPVIIIESFNNFSDALQKTNDSVFGLQAGVFTDRIDELNQAFKALEVGGVIHNGVPTFRVDHMPYGGVKQSGLGREGVKYAMQDMLEPRILVMEQ